MSDIVNKLWGFCHTLRHDGIDYGEYIEQLTYLLFLKMADERRVEIPKGCDWNSLKDKSGTALTDHYQDILRRLREAKGLLGDIFSQSMPRFNNPVNLKRLITLIDEEEWTAMDVDVKGAAFRGPAGEGGERRQEGRGPVLHATRADPVHRTRHAARPPVEPGLHHLRPGLRHRWLSGVRLRVAAGAEGPRSQGLQAYPRGHLFRPGPRAAPPATGPDEPVPARHRADHLLG